MTVSFATHAKEILAVLRAAGQAASPTWLVGDAVVPDGAGWQGTPGQSNYVGYALFSDISGGMWDGSMADPEEDPTAVYQANCTGATPGQARNIADDVRQSVRSLLHTTVDGRRVDSVRFDFASENMMRDDDVQPSVFFCPVRFRVTTR